MQCLTFIAIAFSINPSDFPSTLIAHHIEKGVEPQIKCALCRLLRLGITIEFNKRHGRRLNVIELQARNRATSTHMHVNTVNGVMFELLSWLPNCIVYTFAHAEM